MQQVSPQPFRVALIEDLLECYASDDHRGGITECIFQVGKTYEKVYGLSPDEVSQCEDIAWAIAGSVEASHILALRALRLGLEYNPVKAPWKAYQRCVA